jgi:hypothetical protein
VDEPGSDRQVSDVLAGVLRACLPDHPSACLSNHLSVCCAIICLSVCQTTRPSGYPSICPSGCVCLAGSPGTSSKLRSLA